MRRWVWVSTPLAPVFLIGGWTLAQTRQPDSYDAVRDTISALAAHGAADAWIMTIGLAALGACHLMTAAGFSACAPAARVLLAVGGAATVMVAASPQPAATHAPAAAIGFVALAIWPALLPRELATGRWLSALLLALLAWFAVALDAGASAGLSERALAGAEALTPLAIALLWKARVRSRSVTS